MAGGGLRYSPPGHRAEAVCTEWSVETGSRSTQVCVPGLLAAPVGADSSGESRPHCWQLRLPQTATATLTPPRGRWVSVPPLGSRPLATASGWPPRPGRASGSAGCCPQSSRLAVRHAVAGIPIDSPAEVPARDQRTCERGSFREAPTRVVTSLRPCQLGPQSVRVEDSRPMPLSAGRWAGRPRRGLSHVPQPPKRLRPVLCSRCPRRRPPSALRPFHVTSTMDGMLSAWSPPFLYVSG